MGKRQRERKEKKTGQAAVFQTKKRAGNFWGILAVVVAVIGLLIAGLFLVVYLNRDRFIRVGAVALAQDLSRELVRGQGKYTYDESQRMQKIIFQIVQLSSDKRVDSNIGSRFMFVLQVMQEILRSDEPIKPEELVKMETIVAETERMLIQKNRLAGPIRPPAGKTPVP